MPSQQYSIRTAKHTTCKSEGTTTSTSFHEDSEEEEIVDNLCANPAQNQNRETRQAGGRCNQPDHGQAMGQVLPPQRWEAGFRLDIPEFTGSLNAEDFIDWLNMVEKILDFKQVPDDIGVPLVATHFKNRASAWWSQLKESRRHSGKYRINTWERLKKYMRRSFLPYNYETNSLQ